MTRQDSPAETVVSVEHLTRRFGSQRGVTDVSFDVAAGEVFERRREVDHDSTVARAVSSDIGPHARVRA